VTASAWISEPKTEILDLRHFSSSDLRPLLEEESRRWSDVLQWDYQSSREMILRFVDSRILPGYAAVCGGEVVGYGFFVYEGNKGVIGDLYVREASAPARAALQEELALHSIHTLQHSPGVLRIEAQLLLHEGGAVARPFLRCGFRRHPRLFMLKLLAKGTETRPAVPAEMEIRRWTEHDFPAAAALITACYRGHVDADINDQYRSVAGSTRFLNNIVRFPGCGQFDPAASWVAVHRPTRSLAGLVLCSRIREDVGHITQICVQPQQRGRGIGESLLAASARDLAQRGLAAVSLTVTRTNHPAVALYQRLGYREHRLFDAFVWEG
jgi:ribosomal protein S18 acetylase RimI-like enzyme